MLSEDEKKAIEYAKSLVALFDKGIPLKYLEEENDMVKKLLNLIFKLLEENKTTLKLNTNMSKRHLNDIFEIKNYKNQIDLMAKEMFYENNKNIDLQNFNNYEQIKEYFRELAN